MSDESMARRVEVLRFHGIERLHDETRDVTVASGKYNMSDVSAAIGLAQLAQLQGFLIQRPRLADHYFEVFPQIDGVVLPQRGVDAQSWNMFFVLLPYERLGTTRQAFRAALRCANVASPLGFHTSLRT